MSPKSKYIGYVCLSFAVMFSSLIPAHADEAKSNEIKSVKVTYDHCVVQNTVTNSHMHTFKADGSVDPKPSVLPVVMHSKAASCADRAKNSSANDYQLNDVCVMSLSCLETKEDLTTGKVIEKVPNQSQTAMCQAVGGPRVQTACPSPDTCLKLSNKNYDSYGALASDEYISDVTNVGSKTKGKPTEAAPSAELGR